MRSLNLLASSIWPLLLGAALATFTARWAGWGLGLLAAAWLVRWIACGRPSIRTPLDWAALLLLLTVPVTLLVTTDRQATFVAVSRLLAGLALAYGLANWARCRAHLSLLALGMAGLGLGLALFAPFSVTWPPWTRLPFIPAALYDGTSLRVADTVNPNMMAGALVMALPFPLSMLVLAGSDPLPSLSGSLPGIVARVLDGRWFRRLWFGAAALLALAALLLTRSRGGWIAASVAVLVLLARRWRLFLALIPLALLGLGLLVWRGGVPLLVDAIGPEEFEVLSGWEARAEIWSRAVLVIEDFSLTGVGAGAFARVVDVLYPSLVFGPDAGITHAHNLFLQVAVDLGLPGLVAYLAILLLAFACAWRGARQYRRGGDAALAAFAWAGAASLAGMCVHGLVDATAWIVGRGAFVQWLVIGALLALAGQPETGSCPETGFFPQNPVSRPDSPSSHRGVRGRP